LRLREKEGVTCTLLARLSSIALRKNHLSILIGQRGKKSTEITIAT